MLDGDDLVLLELWQAFRGGGFGAGPLPAPGGMMDQPACVMAAFNILSATAAKLKPKG